MRIKPFPDIFSFRSFFEDEPVLSKYQIFFSVIKRYVGKTLPEILDQIICVYIGLYGMTVLVVDDHEYIADLTEWYDPPDRYLNAVVDRNAFLPDTLRICTCRLIFRQNTTHPRVCGLQYPPEWISQTNTASRLGLPLALWFVRIQARCHLCSHNSTWKSFRVAAALGHLTGTAYGQAVKP